MISTHWMMGSNTEMALRSVFMLPQPNLLRFTAYRLVEPAPRTR